jgi:aminoglycoside 6-adenylyltransferase
LILYSYVGEDLEGNWDALFKTTGLFRRIAIEVGDALGYDYLDDLDEQVTSYLQSIRSLE